MALVPLARIADAPNASAQPLPVARLQAGNGTQGQQWAQAIGQTGVVLGNLHEKYVEISDTRNLIEAENVMRAKTQEFNEWRMNPENADESKWLPKWQQIQNETQKHIDGLKITERARLNLTRSFGRWADGQTISVQGDAFKQGVQRTGDALDLRMIQAVNDMDEDRVKSTVQKGVSLGVYTPERGALILEKNMSDIEGKKRTELQNLVSAAIDNRQIDEAKTLVQEAPFLKEHERKATLADIGARAEARQQADEVQALTLTNPAEAVKLLNDPEKFDKLSPGDRQASIVRAKEVQASGASEAFRDIRTRISLNQVRADDDFTGPGMQDLTPLMRDMLKAENAAHHDATKKAIRVQLQNSPAIYEDAVGVIAKYDPAKDEGGLQKADIGAHLETHFSGTYLEELRKRLDARGTTKPGEIDDAPAIAMLKEWTDAGGLGDLKAPVMQDGKPVVRDPKATGFIETPGFFWGTNKTDVLENDGKPVPVTQIDPVKQAQAASKLSTIRKTIEAEVKAGKFKNNDEVLYRATELFQQHGGKAPAIVPQPAAGFEYLVPGQAGYDAAKADMERAMKAINYKPSK